MARRHFAQIGRVGGLTLNRLALKALIIPQHRSHGDAFQRASCLLFLGF
jgi:hypothetical protein